MVLLCVVDLSSATVSQQVPLKKKAAAASVQFSDLVNWHPAGFLNSKSTPRIHFRATAQTRPNRPGQGCLFHCQPSKLKSVRDHTLEASSSSIQPFYRRFQSGLLICVFECSAKKAWAEYPSNVQHKGPSRLRLNSGKPNNEQSSFPPRQQQQQMEYKLQQEGSQSNSVHVNNISTSRSLSLSLGCLCT